MVDPFAHIYRKCRETKMKDKMASPLVFPRLVDTELTNNCNLKCRMCPTGQGRLTRKQGYMSKEVFASVLSECARHGTAIRMVRWGEPLAHPYFTAFCKAVKDHGLLLHLNTNGILMDEEVMTRWLAMKLDSVKFSFQGVTPDEYRRWRGIDAFTSLFGLIAVLRKRRGSLPYPYIRVGTTVTDTDSESDIAEFKLKFGEIADKVTVKKTRLGNEMGCQPECPEVFDKLSVNWDGSVSACCGDSDNKMLVGNLNEHSLSRIWNFSPDLYDIRDLLVNKRHNELERCSKCCL